MYTNRSNRYTYRLFQEKNFLTKKKKIFKLKNSKNDFFFLHRSIYIPKCAKSNFKKLLEWMLVSLTFLKKVTFFHSKVRFFSNNFLKKGQGDQYPFKKFLKIWFDTNWYINRPMLEKKFFFEFFSWKFFF